MELSLHLLHCARKRFCLRELRENVFLETPLIWCLTALSNKAANRGRLFEVAIY